MWAEEAQSEMLFSHKPGCVLRCLQKGGNLDRTSESKTARHQQSQPNGPLCRIQCLCVLKPELRQPKERFG